MKKQKQKSKLRWKWYYLFNPHFIAFVVVVCIVIWCIYKDKHSVLDKFADRLRNAAKYAQISPQRLPSAGHIPGFNKNEERCRLIFEKIFQTPFRTCRPDWLKNPATGRNLELDGYSPVVRLAFEYDGAQHSQYNRYFHRGGPDEFLYQVKKDNYKDKLCKEHGITLVRIPHFVAPIDLERYIVNKLRGLGMLQKSVP